MPIIKVIGKKAVRQSWMVTLFLERIDKALKHPDLKESDKKFLKSMKETIACYREYSEKQKNALEGIEKGHIS